jgi:hypothetical protein
MVRDIPQSQAPLLPYTHRGENFQVISSSNFLVHLQQPNVTCTLSPRFKTDPSSTTIENGGTRRYIE